MVAAGNLCYCWFRGDCETLCTCTVSGITNRQFIPDKFNIDGTCRAALEVGHYTV
jgi:hypothetical protein